MGQKASSSDLTRFDLWEFCRTGASMSSDQAGFTFERLQTDPNVARVHEVSWALQGFLNKRKESTVQIKGTMRVDLLCAHCQEQYSDELPIDRNWVLVLSEQAAEEYDEENLGEHDDVVACEGYIDLKQWVEDELLLSVPMLPAHPEQCVEVDWQESLEQSGLNGLADNAEPEEGAEKVETHKPFADLDQLIKKRNN